MPPDSKNRAGAWPWIVGAAVAITVLIYSRSLALPFYSDDLVQIPWLRTLRFADLWQEVSPYSYYRPLAFSLWLFIPFLFTHSDIVMIFDGIIDSLCAICT